MLSIKHNIETNPQTKYGNTNLEVTNLETSNLASFIICMRYMLSIGTSLDSIMKIVIILSGVKLGISLLGCSSRENQGKLIVTHHSRHYNLCSCHPPVAT